MPSGKAHNVSITALAAALPIAALAAGLPFGRAAALSAGCLAGMLISPDLDVDHGSISHRLVRRSLGCLPGALWKLFWLPYARLIPHRSWLSHGPLIGTLLRLIYLLGIPAMLWSLLSLVIPLPPLTTPGWSWLPYMLMGLMAADALHALMDKVFH